MGDFIAGEISKRLMIVRVEAATMQRLLRVSDASKAELRLVNNLLETTNALEDLLLSEASVRKQA